MLNSLINVAPSQSATSSSLLNVISEPANKHFICYNLCIDKFNYHPRNSCSELNCIGVNLRLHFLRGLVHGYLTKQSNTLSMIKSAKDIKFTRQLYIKSGSHVLLMFAGNMFLDYEQQQFCSVLHLMCCKSFGICCSLFIHHFLEMFQSLKVQLTHKCVVFYSLDWMNCTRNVPVYNNRIVNWLTRIASFVNQALGAMCYHQGLCGCEFVIFFNNRHLPPPHTQPPSQFRSHTSRRYACLYGNKPHPLTTSSSMQVSLCRAWFTIVAVYSSATCRKVGDVQPVTLQPISLEL